MSSVKDIYAAPDELLLGVTINTRVPKPDQERQRIEVEEILRRLRKQPGVVLADEVGMGKTFVALAVAYAVSVKNRRAPVVVMVPPNLVEKWEQDLKTFCELYLHGRRAVRRDQEQQDNGTKQTRVRYGIARHSIDLLKLLDDTPSQRCQIVLLAQGAMTRRQTDKWIRLGLIREALRRHGRGGASRLIKVKSQIHRFVGELIFAIGEERAHEWGEGLWHRLLREDPGKWRDLYNNDVRDERRLLTDNPVPLSVRRALRRVDVRRLADELYAMPVRASEGLSRKLDVIRTTFRSVEDDLWKVILREAPWRSPLLIMDEAHHLKNPGTRLARQLQSPDSDTDLRTGDGAMSNAFDRMLFLTATPFQLGHRELVHVLRRFGDVRWNATVLKERDAFLGELEELLSLLNESQRAATAVRTAWSRLTPEDCGGDTAEWWRRVHVAPRGSLTSHERAVVDAYDSAMRSRASAEGPLSRWVVRHNKGTCWPETEIIRRRRVDGASIVGESVTRGLQVPPDQLLPFFLAARSAVRGRQDLLGDALCSSYEAFRYTRDTGDSAKDDLDESNGDGFDLSHSRWYLGQFDAALERCSGSMHPKLHATVNKVVDLWEAGEKVLVFAFYRHTCRALRIHISDEIERRVTEIARRQLNERRGGRRESDVKQLLKRVQGRYFDDVDSPGRKALDEALLAVVQPHGQALESAGIVEAGRKSLIEVMRRFLRVKTTLVRCFPLAELDSIKPKDAVAALLNRADSSNVSWLQKFDTFIYFLVHDCSAGERSLYLEAAHVTRTGTIRVEQDDDEHVSGKSATVALANVQVATGATKRETRTRLMRAFNTPFFPDIFVCSEVMGEGVDLQRFCRHVIHHDLAWNPSTIEQRTGRVDRLGCKAEGRSSIAVYLPYLAGAGDERQYQVMSYREQWFRIVMGQEEVARLITTEATDELPLPTAIADNLSFRLGVTGKRR